MAKFKDQLFKSVLVNKCPRCYKGNFFEGHNPFSLRNFSKMNTNCPQCGLSYKQETGFYYGAMYISYGLQAAYVIGLYVLMVMLFNLDLKMYIIACAIVLFLLFPITFRLSRLIYINLIGDYKPKQ